MENEPPTPGPSYVNGTAAAAGAAAGGKAKRKGGETGPAFDMVDAINDERDLYRVLGLTRGAKTEEIRRAYIARSRICHPECVPFPPLSAARSSPTLGPVGSKLPTYPPCTPAFQKLSFAYETLSKPSSRRLYDVSGGRDFAYRCVVRLTVHFDSSADLW